MEPALLLRRFLLLLITIISSSVSSAGATVSYAAHCGSAVPEATATTNSPAGSSSIIQLYNGYFAGGEPVFTRDSDSNYSLPPTFFFHTRSLFLTNSPAVLQVSGTLTFRGGLHYPPTDTTRTVSAPPRSKFRHFRPHLPRGFSPRKQLSFDLDGFWSTPTGILCMVGTGRLRSVQGTLLERSAVFKLSYPNSSTISSSLVGGRVESFDDAVSENHFSPISILAYAQKNYAYTRISEAEGSCPSLKVGEEPLGFGNESFCPYMKSFLRGQFKLDYGRNCSSRHCGPFAKSIGFLPRFLSFNHIECSEDGRLHSYIGVSSDGGHTSNSLLVPEKTLVAEGIWDLKRNRLCLVACRIRNNKEALIPASVDDCTIRVTLWFPAVLSIEDRSIAVGRIWSDQNEDDSGYFDIVSFRTFRTFMNSLPGLRYAYTKVDIAKKSCVQDNTRIRGKEMYPDGNLFGDMRFDIYVSNKDGKSSWGHATPVSIGESVYTNSYMLSSSGQLLEHAISETNHSLWNISYTIVFTFPQASLAVNEPTEIFAEGIYNTATGLICMVGCQYRDFPNVTEHINDGSSMDCGIFINIQLPPLTPKAGEHITGMIMSTREKLDSLFFEPLEISSFGMYTTQAIESIWRIDMEIVIVLLSLTLSCLIVGMQLFHIKKYPDVLPSMSITMLVVLTLGYMIPLVLNFEALFFTRRNRQNILLWTGGWLEVNEVIVRVLMMAAFLLQSRLLQVAWSARSADEGTSYFWLAERKTLLLCLPLYFAGGLIAWFIHLRSHDAQLRRPGSIASVHHSLWEDMLSYAGLILDCFLLPQVILNKFLNSKNKPLAPSFYIGATVLRALPHIYDASRAPYFSPQVKWSFIYARPEGEFYSSAWDIIIPCEGLLFAVLIYLQQRFGGAFFCSWKNQQPGGYEMVSVVSN